MVKCSVSHVPSRRGHLHRLRLHRWHLYLRPHAGPAGFKAEPTRGTSQWDATEICGWICVLHDSTSMAEAGPPQHPARAEKCTLSLIAELSNFLLQQEEIIKAANVDVNGRYMMHNCPVNCLFPQSHCQALERGLYPDEPSLFFPTFSNLVLCLLHVYEVEKSKSYHRYFRSGVNRCHIHCRGVGLGWCVKTLFKLHFFTDLCGRLR